MHSHNVSQENSAKKEGKTGLLNTPANQHQLSTQSITQSRALTNKTGRYKTHRQNGKYLVGR